MVKTLEDIIKEALANPSDIMYVDVIHEDYCNGRPCDCEPEYKEQRKPQ